MLVACHTFSFYGDRLLACQRFAACMSMSIESQADQRSTWGRISSDDHGSCQGAIVRLSTGGFDDEQNVVRLKEAMFWLVYGSPNNETRTSVCCVRQSCALRAFQDKHDLSRF
jgi:hypothetical protein